MEAVQPATSRLANDGALRKKLEINKLACVGKLKSEAMNIGLKAVI